MIKNLLKPSKVKIAITILFLVFSFFHTYSPPPQVTDIWVLYHGFPLYYIKITYGGPLAHLLETRILPLGLLINIIFWYFIICITIFVYKRSKRKESQKK